MRRKRHTAEQIIGKLREAGVLLSQGQAVGEACRKPWVSELQNSASSTYYR